MLPRFLGHLETAATALAAVALALVALFTALSVILRAAGFNLPDAIEFSSLFMAVAVFWGMVGAVQKNELIKVEFLAAVLRPALNRAASLVAAWITFLFFLAMAYAGIRQVALVLSSGEVTPELRVPLWPFLALALTGLLAIAFSAAFNCFPKTSVAQTKEPQDG